MQMTLRLQINGTCQCLNCRETNKKKGFLWGHDNLMTRQRDKPAQMA